MAGSVTRGVAILAGALMLTACQPHKPPQTLPSPVTQVQPVHYLGSPLSGPQVASAAVLQEIDQATQGSKFLQVQIELYATNYYPILSSTQFASRANLFVTPQGQSPVSSMARQTISRSIVIPDELALHHIEQMQAQSPQQTVHLGTLHGGVVPGVTTRLQADFLPTASGVTPRAAFMIYRPLPASTTRPTTGRTAESSPEATIDSAARAAEMDDLGHAIATSQAATATSATSPSTTTPSTTQSANFNAPSSATASSVDTQAAPSTAESSPATTQVSAPSDLADGLGEIISTSRPSGPTTRPSKPFMDIGTRDRLPTTRSAALPEFELALELDQFITLDETASTESAREIAIISFPQSPHDQWDLAIWVPLELKPDKPQFMVAYVHVQRPGIAETQPALIEARQQLLREVRQSSEQAATQPTGYIALPTDRIALDRALSVLDQASPRRASLAYIAGKTGATLASDVTLSSSDLELSDFSKLISIPDARAALHRDPAELGWMLDHAALKYLTQLAAAEQLPSELTAVLTTYAGEVGRHSGTLQVILSNLKSRRELELRLIAENLIYLEDPSPSARVRATDWLRARNRLPAGYDPLARGTERRAALEAAATQPIKP